MIVTIEYKLGEERTVFGVLSELNVHIIRSQDSSWSYKYRIKMSVENIDKVNEILSILNKNTIYGVRLVRCRPTIKEMLFNFFTETREE